MKATKDRGFGGAGEALGSGAPAPGDVEGEGDGVMTGEDVGVKAGHAGSDCHTPLPLTAPCPPAGTAVVVVGPLPSPNRAWNTRLSGYRGADRTPTHRGTAIATASPADSALLHTRTCAQGHPPIRTYALH